MFNLAHILYLVIATVVTIGLLVLCHFTIKQPHYQRWIIQISAVATVIIHYSRLYVDYFTTGSAAVDSTMLLPIYPCNIMMWLLLIVAFKKDLTTPLAKVILEFTFYAGVICGVVGVVLNENFDSNPTLADWDILKGLLSHSTMIFGCLYLLTSGMVKICVSNTLSVCCGILLFLVDGGLVIGLFRLCRLNPPNCMYLLRLPYPQYPWLNTFSMSVAALALVFVITALYEQLALPKAERWYHHLKRSNRI
ncbi:MAG: hypothetical protein NC133_04470 [Prevotella sp.]|nr:hypothetical protein [Prevotella sp.]